MRNVLMSVALVASAAVGIAGCDSGLGAPPSDVIESQVDYNMVIADDRTKFREQDMTYLGSVGPYAVYKITGSDPKLIGPYIKAPSNYGYAMACGAAHYFSTQALAASPEVSLQLHGGNKGQLVLVDVAQHPQDQGGCTTPTDTFGNPLPDMGGGSSGGGGSGGGGGTGTPGSGGGTVGGGCGPDGCPGGGTGGTPDAGVGTPTGGTGDTGGSCGPDGCPAGGTGSGGSSGGATPSDGDSGDVGVQQIGLTFHPQPPVGSTVLVRRVALTAARQHNGSHVEPNICCQDNVCSLQ